MIKGLFILMSESDDHELAAIAAAQLLQKLLDFTKNLQAEVIVKEFVKANPDFISLFGVEKLLNKEASRNAVLFSLKVYVERKESLSKGEQLVKDLIKNQKAQKDLIEHINYKANREQSVERSIGRFSIVTPAQRMSIIKQNSESVAFSTNSSDFFKTSTKKAT